MISQNYRKLRLGNCHMGLVVLYIVFSFLNTLKMGHSDDWAAKFPINFSKDVYTFQFDCRKSCVFP